MIMLIHLGMSQLLASLQELDPLTTSLGYFWQLESQPSQFLITGFSY